MTAETFKFERTVKAPPFQVYRAFTRGTAFREWFCDVALADARLGGRLYFWWNTGYYASGEFTHLTEGEQVTFTWRGRDEPATTRVQVLLEPHDAGTRFTVTHSGIGPGEKWAEIVEQFELGRDEGRLLTLGSEGRLDGRETLGRETLGPGRELPGLGREILGLGREMPPPGRAPPPIPRDGRPPPPRPPPPRPYV